MARLHLEVEAHWAPKQGAVDAECQDVAAYAEQGPRPRFALADGATGGYDSQLWATLLTRGFRDSPPAHQDPTDFARWLGDRRGEWRASAPASFPSLFHEEAWRRGSYATLLGVDVVTVDGDVRWDAVAVGDTVLVHLRGGEPLAVFPELGADDFDLTPDLVHTAEERTDETLGGLRWATGDLLPGDVLLGLTDALAAWALRAHGAGRDPFGVLVGLDHPGFVAVLAALRAADEIVDDDVTLLRAGLTSEPSPLSTGALR